MLNGLLPNYLMLFCYLLIRLTLLLLFSGQDVEVETEATTMKTIEADALVVIIQIANDSRKMIVTGILQECHTIQGGKIKTEMGIHLMIEILGIPDGGEMTVIMLNHQEMKNHSIIPGGMIMKGMRRGMAKEHLATLGGMRQNQI